MGHYNWNRTKRGERYWRTRRVLCCKSLHHRARWKALDRGPLSAADATLRWVESSSFAIHFHFCLTTPLSIRLLLGRSLARSWLLSGNDCNKLQLHSDKARHRGAPVSYPKKEKSTDWWVLQFIPTQRGCTCPSCLLPVIYLFDPKEWKTLPPLA